MIKCGSGISGVRSVATPSGQIALPTALACARFCGASALCRFGHQALAALGDR